MGFTKRMKVALLVVVTTHGFSADDLKRDGSGGDPHGSLYSQVHNASSRILGSFDPNRILCPVLAAMWNAGDLKTDEHGSVELQGMQDALHEGTGCSKALSKFQATGIADFDRANKETELVRERCLPATLAGTACFTRRAAGSSSDSVKRWVNIFTMNGKQVLEHGISTGTRGGATNVPDPETCAGVFPCEARFQKFYVNNAENGRLYRKNLMKIVCAARKYGDRGGEYSYSSGSIHMPGGGDLLPVPAREWQMKAAIQGWLDAFGRTDEKGEWYLTLDDARAMIMEGRYPDGWKKRDWGCIVVGCSDSLVKQANANVECDVGEADAWWGEASVNVGTGETCHLGCNGGATCVEGKCICGRGSNFVGMIAKNGKCVDRVDTSRYFGQKNYVVPATNPAASGNPEAEVTIV